MDVRDRELTHVTPVDLHAENQRVAEALIAVGATQQGTLEAGIDARAMLWIGVVD